MDKLKTTDTGGFPFVLDDLRFIDDGIREAIKGIMNGFLTSGISAFIISGCEISEVEGGGNTEYTVSEGYIFMSGEVFYVPAHVTTGATSYTAYWDIYSYYDAAGNKTFQDLNSHDTYEKRQVKLYIAETPPGGYMEKDAPNLTTQIKSIIGLNTTVDTWHEVGNVSSGLDTEYESEFSGATFDSHPLRFKKDKNNYLVLTGLVIATSDYSSNKKIFTLPAGYCPTTTISVHTNKSVSGGTYACDSISIQADGDVVLSKDFSTDDIWSFSFLIPLD